MPQRGARSPAAWGPLSIAPGGAPAPRHAAKHRTPPPDRVGCTVNPSLPGTSWHCPHLNPCSGTSCTGLAAQQWRRGRPGATSRVPRGTREGLVLQPPGSGLGGTGSFSKRPSPRCPLLTVEPPWQEDQKHKPADASHATRWLEAPRETSVGAKCCQVKRAWPGEGQGKASRTGVTADPRADHRG